MTRIERRAFQGCRSLPSIALPDSVTYIGDRAFQGCRSLTSIVLPDGVTYIGARTFQGCNHLEQIDVDENNSHYASIDGALFTKDCKTLIRYPAGKKESMHKVPDGVTSIEWRAFYGCSSLTSIVLPNGVTSIGGEAFYRSRSLTSIVLPESVTSIGQDAFCGCSSLTSIVLPDGVTSIGDCAFCGCDSLEQIDVDDNNSHYSSIDGALFTKDHKTLIRYPAGKKKVRIRSLTA